MDSQKLLDDFNEISDTDYKSWEDIPREALLRAVIILLVAINITEAG